jgi:alkylation response protein AidB-like acyl-CoA dehydrogenase
MSDGAAKLLSTQLAHPDLDPTTRRVFQDAYDHLTSRNPAKAWTSGQWMTERTGGSDVSGTETVATCSPSPEDMSTPETPLGPWSIDGFKWFSSATDSSMTVLLARTPKGLSTFFAPIHRTRGIPTNSASLHEKELNGIFISRLKNKFGTKSLPTAELELSGTRGYLIGKEGQGIQEISTILNISRLYSAFSALGYVGRGLAIAKGFAKVREVGAGRGKRVILKNAPLHMQTLANITGEYQSMMLFTYFIAWLMGITEHTSRTLGEGSGPRTPLRPDNPSDIPFLLRILTPVLKASVCKRSIHALQECMEALGGVGYLDNTENESINIARLYRDCCVLSIWEGTTDVLASDTLRVLKGRNGDEVIAALDRWISKGLNNARPGAPVRGTEKLNISHSWRVIRDKVRAHTAEEQIPFARHLLFEIADVVMGVLLIVDAESDMDVAATSVCTRFLSLKGITPQHAHIRDWPVRDGLELNQKIVYGGTADTVFASRSKL